MAEVQPIIVLRSRHSIRHLGICNQICVKLLEIMSGVIPCNLKKRRLYLKPFFWRTRQPHRHTDTHTHDDSIRRTAMRCISPNKCNLQKDKQFNYHRNRSSMKTNKPLLVPSITLIKPRPHSAATPSLHRFVVKRAIVRLFVKPALSINNILQQQQLRESVAGSIASEGSTGDGC